MQIKNLFFSYNPDMTKDSFILKDIGFAVKSGEFILICGRSGSGKTTLAHLISGLLKPTDGKVLYDGKDILHPSSTGLKKKAGVILQTPEEQLFEKTVYEDVTFVLRREGTKSDAEIVESVKKTLKLVGLNYDEYKDRLSFSLSSGEKRKAAIACILINSPDLIVFDEPTIGLDYVTKRSLIRTIRQLHGDGKTIICLSHDIDSFIDFSDKIIILNEGEVVFDGNKYDLIDKYDIIKDEIRMSHLFSLIYELKKIDKHITKDVYNADEILSYLKGLVN